mgnify:CR=1 FL=1
MGLRRGRVRAMGEEWKGGEVRMGAFGGKKGGAGEGAGQGEPSRRSRMQMQPASRGLRRRQRWNAILKTQTPGR